MKKRVIIVGAGLGGLATAMRLVKAGYDVEIVEKNEQAGGRLNQIKKDGFTFDTGPSFFSMSYEFIEFVRKCGIEMPFEFVELDPLYSVNFSDNPKKNYHLYKDIDKLAEQFKDLEPQFKEKMEKYLNQSGQVFNDTIDIVVKNNFDSIFDYISSLMTVNPVHLPILTRNFWTQVSKNFSSKEVREILSLVAFFLGRTPFDTMAIYTLLSYTEFKHDGYHNVKGGMYQIVVGLVRELEKAGVKITYNTEIVDYVADETGKELSHLIDANNNTWRADTYVVNADAAVWRHRIFKRRAFSTARMNRMKWTMGYLTFYIGIKGKLPQVNHHNYYLGANYKEYANKVLSEPGTLEKPYYYVNVVSKHNADCAPEGCESLFFVCPVPNLLHKTDWSDKDEIVNSIIDNFSERIGEDIRPNIISRTVYTPEDWQNQFGLYKGSGLGLAHTMMQIGAFRPKNHDERYKNVFYVGASTIPGAGLPMAIISSKLVTERVLKQLKK